MPVQHRPGTPYANELAKWEQHHTLHSIVTDEDGGTASKPGNPYRYQEYPKMLYRAQPFKASGQRLVSAPFVQRYDFPNEMAYGLAMEEAERFTASCQRTVRDESEELLLIGQGWCKTMPEALELARKEEWDQAVAGAEAAENATHMSARAQVEFEAAQEAGGLDHVPDPAPPKKAPPMKRVATYK